jgi:CRISPR-associated protein Csm4
MSLCLFKLAFNTPVHIGSSESARSLGTSIGGFCADTLFSALCHAAYQHEGADGINRMRRITAAFSDAMPYRGTELYLPKPCLSPAPGLDMPPVTRKRFNKLRYLPVSLFTKYIAALSGTEPLPDEINNDFGTGYITEKVAITGQELPQPYSVGLFSFDSGCGLYFIMRYEDTADRDYIGQLLAMQGYTGIGGKVSAGYGKYTASAAEPLSDTLTGLFNATGKFMSLTAALPRDDELEAVMRGCAYTVIRRGGFINSGIYGKPVKKRTQYFFAAGSVFDVRFDGDIYDVSPDGGPHPVYRYAKPLFIGVGT